MNITPELIEKARKQFPQLKDKSDDEVALAYVLARDIVNEIKKKGVNPNDLL